MSKKVIKIQEDIDKTKEKITELREKLKELENRLQEEKNLEILGLVYGCGLSFEQLADLLGAPKKEDFAHEE